MSTNDPHPVLPEITRRRFLQGTALAGLGAFLAACSGSSATTAPGGSTGPAGSNAAIPTLPPASQAPSVAPTPKVVTGPLHWAQWPAYIDLTGAAATNLQYSPGSSPTLEQFKAKYKVDVDYEEKIEDNNTFYATIEPELLAGAPTGWDLIVITDWLAAKVITKGWAEQIDQSNVPNCVANLRDPLKGQAWDPKQRLPLPVAVGHDRDGLRQDLAGLGQDRRADQPWRPVEDRPQEALLPVRGARHVRPGPAQAGQERRSDSRRPPMTCRRSTTTSSRW